MRWFIYVLLCLSAFSVGAAEFPPSVLSLPEAQRQFFVDGAGWLLSPDQRATLLAESETDREAWIKNFLTPALGEAVQRRRGLYETEGLSPHDHRAQLLFLHGEPQSRDVLDCPETFRPLEIWTYAKDGQATSLVLYLPTDQSSYRLWLPLDTRSALFTPAMDYLMRQVESALGPGKGRKYYRKLCPNYEELESLLGLVSGSKKVRFQADFRTLLGWLRPPASLEAWTEQALKTSLPESLPELHPIVSEPVFPSWEGQRVNVRVLVTLPTSFLTPFEDDNGRQEYRVAVQAAVENERGVFEDFRARFHQEPHEIEDKAVIAIRRALRQGKNFLLRMTVKDEVGGGESSLRIPIRVPQKPKIEEVAEVPDEVMAELEMVLATDRLGGVDSLTLIPPTSDVVLGHYRAEAIVTGNRITEVRFLLDGQEHLKRTRQPYTVEMTLPNLPQPITLGAIGYDATGQEVASDQLMLNQPTGRFRVEIVSPKRGGGVLGTVPVQLVISVPEGRWVDRVEYSINEKPVGTQDKSPWTTSLDLTESMLAEEIVYLTVVAHLDDDQRTESVRFLKVPTSMDAVDVQLVELYTTIADRQGRLVRDMQPEDVVILENERKQKVERFELVDHLPLTLGFTIDTSTSMIASLGEAQRAATGFLDSILTPKDRTFVVGFADRPTMLIPRTDDATAVGKALEDLHADGWTSLHDAVVFSLYYFKGTQGRRALVVLSDGDDTRSLTPFRDTLEFARRSGVVIYTVGLDNESLNQKAKKKLRELAEATGGRSYVIKEAADLRQVYRNIEAELRSQYLIAYASDHPEGEDYRTVKVEVGRRGLTARTIDGYYP